MTKGGEWDLTIALSLIIRLPLLTFNKSSPWRNWLARLTVNQEVGSSSLPGDVSFCFYFSCLRLNQALIRQFLLDVCIEYRRRDHPGNAEQGFHGQHRRQQFPDPRIDM